MNKIYCFKCRKYTETRDVKQKTKQQKTTFKCFKASVFVEGKKSEFISAGGKGFINDTINSLPFEMHMPGHNFTGPGTKLNKCLNEDMTPTAWQQSR